MIYPQDFEKIIFHIFQNEGGFSNEKYDKGSETNYGITKFTLLRAKRNKIISEDVLIRNLSIEQAKLIYYKLFWLPNRALNLIQDLLFKYLHFDSSVNHGLKQANKFFQLAIKFANEKYFYNNSHLKFPIDGIVGEKTKLFYKYAVVEYKDELPLYFIYLTQRYNFYNKIVQHNSNQKKFLQGWLNRLQQFAERSVSFKEA